MPPLTRPLPYVERALRTPRRRFVAATLARLRAEHPELRTAPPLSGLRAVANRCGFETQYVELPRLWAGRACTLFGIGFVQLNVELPRSLRRLVYAHELSHLWLGHTERGTLLQWRIAEAEDGQEGWGPLWLRSEDEADLLAAALLGMPVEAFRPAVAPFFTQADVDADAEAAA